ncbi:MAG: VOC family protein [Bacteriovoracaceae bacterium]|nr:VOC family protein [Bacteriovoracaceae bacterium]
MTKLSPFHLALPVKDIKKAIDFYHHGLGLPLGRQSKSWVDVDFFGHQIVFHQAENVPLLHYNDVDKHDVPVPHFGVVLEKNQWNELSEKLLNQGVKFVIEPYIRFEGLPGEQGTFFFIDPNGLALEFKTFKDLNQLFAKD